MLRDRQGPMGEREGPWSFAHRCYERGRPPRWPGTFGPGPPYESRPYSVTSDDATGKGRAMNFPTSRTGKVAGLGLTMATALVVGNMIGSGVFLLPSRLGSSTGRSASSRSLFTAVGAILLALVFAGLGRAYPEDRRALRRTAAPRLRRLRRLPGTPGATGSPPGRAMPPIAIAFVSYLGEYSGTVRTNRILVAASRPSPPSGCARRQRDSRRAPERLHAGGHHRHQVRAAAAIAVIGLFYVAPAQLRSRSMQVVTASTAPSRPPRP